MMPVLRSRWLRRLIGIVLTAGIVAVGLGVGGSDPFGAVDRALYDARLRHRTPVLDERVIIIDFSGHSALLASDRRPFMADLVRVLQRLAEHGPPAAVGVAVAESLPEAVRGRHLVTGYRAGSRLTGALPLPAGAAAAPALRPGAPATGFLDLLSAANREPDGILRAIPLLARPGDAADAREPADESFALAMLRQYLGNAAVRFEPPTAAQPRALAIVGERGQIALPLSGAATALVPVSGRGGAEGGRFQYVRAGDVLAGDVDWSLFRDRIVLIGPTAPGPAGLRATPTGSAFPEIEIHAALIAGALDGHLQRRPAHAVAIGSALTASVGLLLALTLPAIGMYGALGVTLIAALVWLGSHVLLSSNFALVLPVAATLAAILVPGLFNAVAGWFAEERARRRMLARFGDYVSPHLVERMARDPMQWNTVESGHRELSILFADVRGFTRIAETAQPEILRDYLTSFLTAMTEVIHSHHGTVDKYMGDAVMAFWGAPVDDPAHADHAVAAGLAMQREVERLSASFAQRGLPSLAVGIGINTGIVRVGNMGSLLRRTYTVIGDAVNLASRLESLTRRHEVPIIVGEATARQCRLQRFRELGRTEIAGRSESVRIFVPLGDDEQSGRADEGAPGKTYGNAAHGNARGGVTDHPPAGRRHTGRLHEGTGSGL